MIARRKAHEGRQRQTTESQPGVAHRRLLRPRGVQGAGRALDSTAPIIPSPATSRRTCSVYDGARGAQSGRFARSHARNCWPNGSTPSPTAPASSSSATRSPTMPRSTSPTRITGRSSRKSARATSAAATISPSPAPMTASGTRSRSSACATLRSSRAYYGNAVIALVERGLARAVLSDHVAAQRASIRAARRRSAHRDYHLGFQSAEAIERFPVHVQRLSPVLTLQGAVAHCDMPLETRADALSAVLAELPARLYGDRRGRSFATISTSITSSCRSPRATRCFSTRPSSTPRERTARRTCAASPICCRSPRPSAARWRASTGSR